MLSNLWLVFWNVFIIFIFVMWFWLLISVIGDLFRRTDAGGFLKVLWIILLVLLPFLGVFLYLLTQSSGMAERNIKQVERSREELRNFVGVSTADEIEKLDKLKASGSISADEHARLRAKLVG